MTDKVPLPEPSLPTHAKGPHYTADHMHTHAAAVSAADNAALREAADELESLCAAKQTEIDALRKLYRSQTKRVKTLEDALREVVSVTQAGSFASNIARAALEQKA